MGGENWILSWSKMDPTQLLSLELKYLGEASLSILSLQTTQAIQNTQNNDTTASNMENRTLVPLTVPERKIDGVIVNQGVEYVRLPH